MEKHNCKLCFRSFSNGRALGGHMRSHTMNLPLPAKPEEESSRPVQLSFEADSAPSSSSSSSSSEEDGDDDKGLCYGLRENPKRSIRLVDPEFSFAAADTGSLILQDRESETESSRNNPTRGRSKRPWKLSAFDYHNNNKKDVHDHEHEPMMKKAKLCKASKTESWVDYEPVSSVSDATTEEDVAFCLMMLSRDKWKRQKDQHVLVEDQLEEEEEEEDEDEAEDEEDEDEDDEAERSTDDSDDESEDLKVYKNRVRGRYKCETCSKVFKSYQALGGHRASHKKIKVRVTAEEPEFERENNGGICAPTLVERKIHECPVCFRVFASGQALGGHKRTHVTGSATNPVPSSTKFGNNKLIDLNLPAPVDDDDISQIENSAVSDAEFVRSDQNPLGNDGSPS